MVDERRVRLLLQRVSENLDHLRELAAEDRSSLRADFDRLAALKYLFVVAIEGCLNVAQHLCASEGWGPPTDNADAMRLLGRHRAVRPDLADAMAKAVGFRNVLVHGYTGVDDDRVVAFLDRLDDLDRFVGSVASWLDSQMS